MNFDSYIVSDTKIAKSILLGEATNFSNKRFSFKSLKQKAFTLAEVLITLSIIGVVAALTVPTLMSNSSNEQHVVGLRKAYSTLSNAMRMLPARLGCGTDFQCALSALPPPNSSFGSYYYPDDVSLMYGIANQFRNAKFINYECTKNVCYNGYFETPDGMAFGWHSTSSWYDSSTGALASVGLIDIDTNGYEKGPNKWGKDWHSFIVPLDNFNGVSGGTVIPYGSNMQATQQIVKLATGNTLI